MSNLRLLNETVITSDVTTVDITDVFTSDFDIYKIVFNDMTKSNTTGQNVDMRYINSAGSIISANYDYARLLIPAYTGFVEDRGTNQTFLAGIFSSVDGTTGFASNGVVYVFNPTNTSSYTFNLQQSTQSGSGGYYAEKQIGVLKQTNSITGFRAIVRSSETINSANIKTYGLRVDS
jgi:hypothetical protein